MHRKEKEANDVVDRRDSNYTLYFSIFSKFPPMIMKCVF
jgi:hypothetical protein